MAEIKFYANIIDASADSDGQLINNELGSGIGFYGTGFGVSVPIGTRQQSTFVTDEFGVNQGSNLHNTQTVDIGDTTTDPVTQGTVKINSLDPINLQNLPNYQCPLNIRFTHPEAVSVQNCKLIIFDRENIENHASGVVTYVYEGRHPSTEYNNVNLAWRGREENTWFEFDPADTDMPQEMPFTASPGASGLNTQNDTNPALGYLTNEGPGYESTRHDWYVALSSEPVTVGSKTQYGLYFSVEYL